MGALTGPQSWAMDEGFSDWYALDFLNAEAFEPDSPAPGELRAGKYVNDAIRTQPFDCPVGASAPACPGAGAAGPGGYTYVTSAGSPGSRRFTQTARSGPRPCGTCGRG